MNKRLSNWELTSATDPRWCSQGTTFQPLLVDQRLPIEVEHRLDYLVRTYGKTPADLRLRLEGVHQGDTEDWTISRWALKPA